MTTLWNKRTLAAVARETPEGTRNSRAQNTLDPELTQNYISQVSDEIEGRVSRKLSNEFSRTESGIFGTLSEPDEFLLNPQVRTFSVAVSGTTGNNISEKRETTGDRSSDNPCPTVGYFFNTLVILTAQMPIVTLTWWQEVQERFAKTLIWRQKLKKRFPTAPLVLRQESKRRCAPLVSHNFAVRIPLRQLKQTRFCWPFNNWRWTVIQPIWTTISKGSRNCSSPLQR